MESQEHQHHFCGKDCLIKAAIMALNRLNLTIDKMKRWTSERTSLQSEIWRLQTTLQTVSNISPSILLCRDPIVRHQSEEIQRLATTNDCMKTKLKSMSNALLKTERTIAWNVDKKVRSEMARINSQVAEERLQLAREITRLKKQLEDADANTTLQQIKSELCEFAESDRKLDRYLSQVTNKVIHTVNNLSTKFVKMNETLKKCESEKIYLQSESEQLKYLLAEKNKSDFQSEYHSCLDEQEIQQVELQTVEMKSGDVNVNYIDVQVIKDNIAKLQNEKELLLKEKTVKEKALTRNVSGVKTKLTIALMRNEKLNEKIKSLERDIVTKLSAAKADSSIEAKSEIERLEKLLELTKEQLRATNTRLVCLEEKWGDGSNENQLESDLIMLKEQNNDMAAQLVMERTTAKEALKEFERSTKEVERLEAELEDVKLMCITLKKDLAKIKMDNSELRDAKMTYKKRSVTLNQENINERESLQGEVRVMKIRVNKLMGDLKKSNNKINQYEETTKGLKEEKSQLQDQVDVLIKGLEEITEDFKKMNEQNLEIHETMKKLEFEKGEWTIEHDNLNNKLRNFEFELENCKTDNLNVNQLLDKSNELNKELQSTCQQTVSEIQTLTDRLNVAENECKELQIHIENISPTISSPKFDNTEMKKVIENLNIENNRLKADQMIIDKEKVALERHVKKLQHQMKNQSIMKYSNIPIAFKDELTKQSVEGSKEMIQQDFATKAFNQFVNHSEKTFQKNLEETDKELQSVKNELAKVRGEVGFLRNDLDNGKFGLRSLTAENCALKEELAKLRIEKHQLESSVRELGKVYKSNTIQQGYKLQTTIH